MVPVGDIDQRTTITNILDMTQEKLNKANELADRIGAVDSVLRRLDTAVNSDLKVITAAVGKIKLKLLLNEYRDRLTQELQQL